MTTETQNPEGQPQGTPEGQPQGTPTETPQRPDNVPEAFWDAEKGTVNTEALLASYAELASKQTPPEGGTEGGAEGEGDAPPPEVPPSAADQYAATVEKANAELASETGQLSDETYAQFEQMGIARERVDEHIEGRKAVFELRKLYAEREAGGEDAYAGMLQWASANYTPEEAEAYNAAVFGNDKDAAMQAVRALKTRYEETMGNDGKIVTDGTGAPSTGGYTGRDEWLADLRNPEYKRNQAFRDNVKRKLEASMRAGTDMGIAASVR